MLRFLATGHSFSYLEEVDLKIHWTAISGIVIKVCDAVYDCLKDKYLQNTTKADWKGIDEKTQERWQFPNCIGAVRQGTYIYSTPLKILIRFWQL